jgi:hypothetical protein
MKLKFTRYKPKATIRELKPTIRQLAHYGMKSSLFFCSEKIIYKSGC